MLEATNDAVRTLRSMCRVCVCLCVCVCVSYIQVKKKLEEVKDKKQRQQDEDYLPDGFDRCALSLSFLCVCVCMCCVLKDGHTRQKHGCFTTIHSCMSHMT